MAEDGGRITMSEARMGQLLAELELRLVERITRELAAKASLDTVTALERRLSNLEGDALRKSGPVAAAIEKLTRAEEDQEAVNAFKMRVYKILGSVILALGGETAYIFIHRFGG